MPFEGKPLADGQLPNAKGTLYTVPAARTAYVRTIVILNTNAAPQQVELYVNVSGTSRRIHREAALAQWAKIVLTDPIVLAEGDLIEGHTTTAAAVDYFITGAEET